MRLLLALAATLLVSSTAGAVTVINGSFENSGLSFARAAESTAFTAPVSPSGWTIFRGSVDYIGQQWQAADGNWSLSLAGGQAGGITQRIGGFVAGQRYRLSFDVAANPESTRRSTSIFYSVTGGEAARYSVAGGNSPTNMQYKHVTYDFTASSALQQIAFSGVESQFGAVLDNIQIDAISAIPEPATWGLMIAGFACTGALVRRRARMHSTLA